MRGVFIDRIKISRWNMCDFVLCFSPIIKYNDKNLVQNLGQFKVDVEIRSLQFKVLSKSPYICESWESYENDEHFAD